MAKDPAFLFYSSDFLTGTMLFTDEQVGKYVRLMCLQHQKGYLTEKDMLKICETYDKDIFTKFSRDPDGNFFNERLRFEIEKRKAYSESRKANRSKSKKDMSNICESYVGHMENENENENEIINGIRKGVQGKTKDEIRQLLFADEVFIRDIHGTHPGKDYSLAFNQCYDWHMQKPNPPNQLWQWRQKVMTWLNNMNAPLAAKAPKKKLTLKDLES